MSRATADPITTAPDSTTSTPTGYRRLTASRIIVIVVVLFVVIWCVINVAAYFVNRDGQPKNIDEAGYFGYALNDLFAARRGGLVEWVSTVFGPSIQAPLTTALTSVLLMFGGEHFGIAMGLVTTFAGATLLLTFALGRKFGRVAIPVLAVAILATTPQFIMVSRQFVFAVPAAAVTAGALYALLRSNRLRSLPWTVAFGVLLGLMPLTRTVTIAFVPSIALAAVLQVVFFSEQRHKRLIHLAIAAGVCILVAATWLGPNGVAVFQYLTDYGYGKQSSAYAIKQSATFGAFLINLTNAVQLPHLIVLVAGFVLTALVVVWRWRSAGLRVASREVLMSRLFPSAILTLGGSAALISSPNAGLGFVLPLLPGASLIASWGIATVISRARPVAPLRITVTALVVLLVLLATPFFGIRSFLNPHSAVSVPGLGNLPISGGADDDPAYGQTVANGLNSRDLAPKWDRASSILASIELRSPNRVYAAFGFRNHFVNVNTVQLDVLERVHYGVGVAQIDPAKMDSTVAAYDEWLTTGEAGPACLLFTSRGKVNEFTPVPNVGNLETAARATGFIETSTTVTLPDGRVVDVWKRSGHGC